MKTHNISKICEVLWSGEMDKIKDCLVLWESNTSDLDTFISELLAVFRHVFPQLEALDHEALFEGHTLDYLFFSIVKYHIRIYLQWWCRGMIARFYHDIPKYRHKIDVYTKCDALLPKADVLRHFTSIQKLKINELDGDISWLTSLSQLKQLWISDLTACDLEPLYELKSLTLLSITFPNCPPIDIQRLTHLEEIVIPLNHIKEGNRFDVCTSLRRLSLVFSRMTSLPDDFVLPQGIEQCELPWHHLKPPYSKAFSGLPSLTIEDPNMVSLLSIMPELRSLNIRDRLGEHKPIQPQHLKELIFNVYDEPNFPWLGECTDLRVLTLACKSISTLPDGIAHCTQLRELYIPNLGLTCLPDWLGQLKALEVLDCSKNRIKTIPSCIQQLTQLRTLNLSSNMIKKGIISLKALTRLEHLNLHENRIGKSPEWLCTLSSLKTVDLSMNQLKKLPEEIDLLKNLKSLNISRNRLEHLPTTLLNIAGLEELLLHNNKLTEIPLWSNHTNRITTLDLSCNNLKKTPAWLLECRNLLELNLSHNPIREFPDFRRLLSLRSLKLNRLNLSRLPPTLRELKSLIDLSLADNQFKELDPVLISCPMLRKIHFQGNVLKDFPIWLNQFKYLSHFKFNNPLFFHPVDAPFPSDSFWIFQISSLSVVDYTMGDPETDPDLLYVY